MGRPFNFDDDDDEQSNQAGDRNKPFAQDYNPDDDVDEEAEVDPVPSPTCFILDNDEDTPHTVKPEASSYSSDDALIDQDTREKLERAKARTLDAAKVAGKHSRHAAQFSARLAKTGAVVAKDQVGKALAYRPSASIKRSALAVLVVSVIVGMGFGAWRNLTEPTKSAPEAVTSYVEKAPVRSPLVSAEATTPSAPAAPVADPSALVAGELAGGQVEAPAPIQPVQDDLATAAIKATPEKATTKRTQADHPVEKANPKPEKAGDKEWAEKANAQLDGFFDQLNEQESKE